MRSLIPLILTLLTACATAAPAVEDARCSAEGTETFLGQRGSSEIGAAIMRATHSSTLRWAPPGAMLTMDFSPGRVTVRLGPDGKVTAIDCG